MQIQIDQDRLAKITKLSEGSHDRFSKGVCAMEAVAYIAREKFSDHPDCACPVIAAFMRSWNDALNDEDRNKLLLPIIPKLVGTRGSKALEARRATMAADWYVRVFTPAWLRLAGLDKHADTLASFPEILSFEKTPSIRAALEAAWSAAWSAARSAAESAAESAARSAARSAAWSAARSAAWSAAESAARSAARSAAWSAARSAARSAAESAAESAARSAADQKLKSTADMLQQSALVLIERMIAATDEAEGAQ